MARRHTGAKKRCKQVTKHGVKMHGRFKVCIVAPKRAFDRRSFRYKRVSKRTFVLVGCPRGRFRPRAKRCDVGTRAYKTLTRIDR